MKKGIKRKLAFLLALVMCVSTTGVAAYAEATFNALGYNRPVYKTLENNILAEYKDKLVNFYYDGDLVGDGLGDSPTHKRAGIQVKLSRKDLNNTEIESSLGANHGITCWLEEYSLLYTSPHSFSYWVD